MSTSNVDLNSAASSLDDSLELCLDNLKDLTAMDFPVPLEDVAVEVLARVWEHLHTIPAVVSKLKRKLRNTEQMLPPPETAKKQKTSATHRFGSKDHVADLIEQSQPGEYSFSNFVHQVCTMPEETSEGILELAFQCALTGFTQFTDQEVAATLNQYHHNKTTAAMVEICNNTPLTQNTASVKAIFDNLDNPNAITNRSTHIWLRYICSTIQLLWFMIEWNLFNQDADSKKKKSAKIQAAFLGKERAMTKEEKKSDKFIKFKGRFEALRTGASRLLTAYETVGTIVIVHPFFIFRGFKNFRTGPKVVKLLDNLQNQLTPNSLLSILNSNALFEAIWCELLMTSAFFYMTMSPQAGTSDIIVIDSSPPQMQNKAATKADIHSRLQPEPSNSSPSDSTSSNKQKSNKNLYSKTTCTSKPKAKGKEKALQLKMDKDVFIALRDKTLERINLINLGLLPTTTSINTFAGKRQTMDDITMDDSSGEMAPVISTCKSTRPKRAATSKHSTVVDSPPPKRCKVLKDHNANDSDYQYKASSPAISIPNSPTVASPTKQHHKNQTKEKEVRVMTESAFLGYWEDVVDRLAYMEEMSKK
ncbi:hypothetical protein BDV93DRAFT_510906 [Ceratobasidium sp. AG-I]|nr:hypothetical protein BDV93DRAFT_510906 [Ceratobasidium sp. AG-I]